MTTSTTQKFCNLLLFHDQVVSTVIQANVELDDGWTSVLTIQAKCSVSLKLDHKAEMCAVQKANLR